MSKNSFFALAEQSEKAEKREQDWPALPPKVTRARTKAGEAQDGQQSLLTTPSPTRSASARKHSSRNSRERERKAEEASDDEALAAAAATEVQPIQLFSDADADATPTKSIKKRDSGSKQVQVGQRQEQEEAKAIKPATNPVSSVAEGEGAANPVEILSSAEKRVRRSSIRQQSASGAQAASNHQAAKAGGGGHESEGESAEMEMRALKPIILRNLRGADVNSASSGGKARSSSSKVKSSSGGGNASSSSGKIKAQSSSSSSKIKSQGSSKAQSASSGGGEVQKSSGKAQSASSGGGEVQKSSGKAQSASSGGGEVQKSSGEDQSASGGGNSKGSSHGGGKIASSSDEMQSASGGGGEVQTSSSGDKAKSSSSGSKTKGSGSGGKMKSSSGEGNIKRSRSGSGERRSSPSNGKGDRTASKRKVGEGDQGDGSAAEGPVEVILLSSDNSEEVADQAAAATGNAATGNIKNQTNRRLSAVPSESGDSHLLFLSSGEDSRSSSHVSSGQRGFGIDAANEQDLQHFIFSDEDESEQSSDDDENDESWHESDDDEDDESWHESDDEEGGDEGGEHREWAGGEYRPERWQPAWSSGSSGSEDENEEEGGDGGDNDGQEEEDEARHGSAGAGVTSGEAREEGRFNAAEEQIDTEVFSQFAPPARRRHFLKKIAQQTGCTHTQANLALGVALRDGNGYVTVSQLLERACMEVDEAQERIEQLQDAQMMTKVAAHGPFSERAAALAIRRQRRLTPGAGTKALTLGAIEYLLRMRENLEASARRETRGEPSDSDFEEDVGYKRGRSGDTGNTNVEKVSRAYAATRGEKRSAKSAERKNKQQEARKPRQREVRKEFDAVAALDRRQQAATRPEKFRAAATSRRRELDAATSAAPRNKNAGGWDARCVKCGGTDKSCPHDEGRAFFNEHRASQPEEDRRRSAGEEKLDLEVAAKRNARIRRNVCRSLGLASEDEWDSDARSPPARDGSFSEGEEPTADFSLSAEAQLSAVTKQVQAITHCSHAEGVRAARASEVHGKFDAARAVGIYFDTMLKQQEEELQQQRQAEATRAKRFAHSSEGRQVQPASAVTMTRAAAATGGGPAMVVAPVTEVPSWDIGVPPQGGCYQSTFKRVLTAFDQYVMQTGGMSTVTFKSLVRPDLRPTLEAKCDLPATCWNPVLTAQQELGMNMKSGMTDEEIIAKCKQHLKPPRVEDHELKFKGLRLRHNGPDATLLPTFQEWAEKWLAMERDCEKQDVHIDKGRMKELFKRAVQFVPRINDIIQGRQFFNCKDWYQLIEWELQMQSSYDKQRDMSMQRHQKGVSEDPHKNKHEGHSHHSGHYRGGRGGSFSRHSAGEGAGRAGHHTAPAGRGGAHSGGAAAPANGYQRPNGGATFNHMGHSGGTEPMHYQANSGRGRGAGNSRGGRGRGQQPNFPTKWGRGDATGERKAATGFGERPPLQDPSIEQQLQKGPYWHDSTCTALGCRDAECGSSGHSTFCQGCGWHGHSRPWCYKAGEEGFNATGYWSVNRRGQAPLPGKNGNFRGTARANMMDAEEDQTSYRQGQHSDNSQGQGRTA